MASRGSSTAFRYCRERRVMKAYFTVEAACILPLVFGVYVFLIYGMFYQYDRCLLDQDVALMVLKEQWADEQKTTVTGAQTQELEQYLAFGLEENALTIEKGTVRGWARGTVDIPFNELKAWTKQENWELEASFTSVNVKPTEWIRLTRKIMEGIGNVTDGIREEP